MSTRREALTLLPGGWIPEAYRKCGFSNLSNAAAISLAKDAVLATAFYQTGGKLPSPSAILHWLEGPKPEPKLEKYAHELKNWTLMGGERVVNVFPDAGKAAGILLGEEDPTIYLPLSKLPIQLQDSAVRGGGAFKFIEPKANPNDTRKVTVTRGIQRISADWLQPGSPAVVELSPEVQASTIRLPILVKELSHMWIQPPLIEFYTRRLEQLGIMTLKTSNPNNVPTTRNEELSIYLMFLTQYERSQNGYSSMLELVDAAAALEAAPLFATWKQEQEQKGLPIPNIRAVDLTQQYIDYADKNGMLDRRPNKVTWKEGLKPQLGTIEYARFVAGFLKEFDPQKKPFLLPID